MSDAMTQLIQFEGCTVAVIAPEDLEELEAKAAQLAEAERKLATYGRHLPYCRSLVYLTSMPPKTQPCDCGLVSSVSATGAPNE